MKAVRKFKWMLVVAALLPLSGWAQDGAPYVIFITENTPAQEAIQSIVIDEYNATERDKLRTTDFTAWENYEPVTSWRDLPSTYRNARYDEIKNGLGLADDDPADKGFTDLLTANGYDVYRSETIRTQDPITGATDEEHEFWGDIGEAYSATGDYRLSQEQIDKLNSADLIVVSFDVTWNRYSAGGREAGQASTVLIDQWNAIEVPIIVMHNTLMGTMEFGSWGWGLSYGFSGQWNAIAPYDRRLIPGEERFVFPDLRPQVTTNDPVFLADVEIEDDNRLSIFKDYDNFPILPQVQQKFSNNMNYNYPASANVVLELKMPSFYVAEVGDIPVHTPVMIEFPPDVPAFTPEGGVPVLERVATPADYRLYFAMGMADTGLYNLSAKGEQVLLNAAAKYTGQVVEPSGLTVGEWNVTDIGFVYGYTPEWGYSIFMGFVYMGNEPWIYQIPFGYMYMANATPIDGGGTTFWFYSPSLEWIFVSDKNGGFFQYSAGGYAWDNFLDPNS